MAEGREEKKSLSEKVGGGKDRESCSVKGSEGWRGMEKDHKVNVEVEVQREKGRTFIFWGGEGLKNPM